VCHVVSYLLDEGFDAAKRAAVDGLASDNAEPSSI
jgi:hypothetical protein